MLSLVTLRPHACVSVPTFRRRLKDLFFTLVNIALISLATFCIVGSGACAIHLFVR